MSAFGATCLFLAFAVSAASVAALLAARILGAKKGTQGGLSDTLAWGARVAAVVSMAALFACCAILVAAFLAGDYSMQYVLDNHSNTQGALGLLYKVSGLWAGREGSLLFWAWLISAFSAGVALKRLKSLDPLDNVAVLVLQAVVAAFVGVMLFSLDNNPFVVTDSTYYGSDGTLDTAATVLGMNTLLEHWAMAIHPPMLFIGYAGLTVPFAYAVAALAVNDPSSTWVGRCSRCTLVSWVFLGIGIGLGSIWAYVVLGWGGYWGWDAVENASLLSWLMGVALIHSFTVYRQRGAFKRWAVLCACLTFAFVIVGTFISRSGLVQSVHAFEGDPVSLALFGALIVLSVACGVVGVVVRRESFGPKEGEAEADSMLTKDALYYLNNMVMVAMTVLLAYLTVASALPSFLPLGGQSLGAGAYNAIARPVGILYLGVLAVCPLVSWGRTSKAKLLKQLRIPAVCALAVFAGLMVYFAMVLCPAYDAAVAQGGSAAESLLEQGPELYYKALSVVGFAVASLLACNAVAMLVRAVRTRRVPLAGGSLAHMGMAVVLVGLIGSSMYVTEVSGYLDYDKETDSSTQTFAIADYELSFTGSSVVTADNGNVLYTVEFDVEKDGSYLGHVAPSVELVVNTQQQKQNAAVISLPGEDLFVVYKGVSETNGGLSLDARVNPLISFVWAGFALLVLGGAVSALGRRGARKKAA